MNPFFLLFVNYIEKTIIKIVTDMKKILFLMLTMLVVTTACGGNASGTKGGSATEKKEKTAAVHLDKAAFMSKIYNYEANPNEWKFEGERPAIVDFYASWCGPCRMVAPIVEELAAEYQGTIDVYKIDTDAEKELAAAFGIRSIPTLLFIPLKGEPQVVNGAISKSEFKKMIDDFLLKK